jgi:hypothetical protein
MINSNGFVSADGNLSLFAQDVYPRLTALRQPETTAVAAQ